MSKQISWGLVLLACSPAAFAVDYYTCATNGQFTTNSNGVTGCTATPTSPWASTWNQAANRLFVGNNFTSPNNFIFNGTLVVTGTLTLGSGSTGTYRLNTGATVRNGGSITWGGNRELEVSSGAVLLIEAGGTVTGTAGASSVEIIGTVTGAGTISANGGITLTGSGSINGSTTAPGNSVNLNAAGLTWNGAAWSPATPSAATHRAIFNGNFQKSIHGPFTAGLNTVNAGVTVTYDNDDELNALNSVLNNGTIVLQDNATLGAGLTLTGSGNLVLRRSVNLPSNQYIRIGFPVTAGPIFSALSFNNFTQRPTYRWNASNSSWAVVAAGSSLNATAFALFGTAGSNRDLSLSIPNAQLNNAAMSFPLAYHDPGAVGGFINSVTDGWNQLHNPFMDFLDVDAVVAAMALTSDFQSDAVSVWNGTQYQVRSTGGGGDADAEFMQPFEAFFVRTDPGHSGSFQITNAMRAGSRPGSGSFVEFKSAGAAKTLLRRVGVVENISISLTASVDGKAVRTYVAQNPAATASFDGGPEVPFQFPLSTMPMFYSIDQDGLALRMNHLGTVHKRSIPIGFDYHLPGTVTLETDLISMPRGVHAELYDRVTGRTLRIDKQPYTFEHRGDEPLERFELRFKGNTRNL